VKVYTRAAYLATVKPLLDEMERDHEEHTGVTATDEMPFEEWQDEITALHANTVA